MIFEKYLQEGLKKAPAALRRLANNLQKPQKPPVPIMSQEDYERLPYFERCILVCNVIGCGKVVSTHGMLCVEHTLEMKYSLPLKEDSNSNRK